jgi:hypothetical protein
MEFFDDGGAGEGKKEGREGAALSQSGRLLEPYGLSVWHVHGDFGSFSQDDTQPWEQGGKPPLHFGREGFPADALKGVGQVDAEDA